MDWLGQLHVREMNVMPTATRTFRVFVSSTFEDLKAERDVFPRLRKLCEENTVRGLARLQAIDLH
jgi:hypothetical protein